MSYSSILKVYCVTNEVPIFKIIHSHKTGTLFSRLGTPAMMLMLWCLRLFFGSQKNKLFAFLQRNRNFFFSFPLVIFFVECLTKAHGIGKRWSKRRSITELKLTSEDSWRPFDAKHSSFSVFFYNLIEIIQFVNYFFVGECLLFSSFHFFKNKNEKNMFLLRVLR